MIFRQKSPKPRTIKAAPKSKINMKNYIRGFFFCAMWYLSIIAGFFILICPVLPLVLISPKKYRMWSDRIFGLWEPFPVAMMEICLGVRVVLTGDKINPFEGSLFIMNHRTRVDWNFLWLGLFHCCQPNAHNMKYILKSPLMHYPGPGWVMQTCSFIFVHRKWVRDRPLLKNIIEYLNESDCLYQILIFPEGTNLSEKNIKKSNKYAEENNLGKYYKVLHPKTTGFAFIATKMKEGGQLGAVYDVTIAYPKTLAQDEYDLLRGKFPEEVHFHVKRYSSKNLPSEDEQLRAWLNEVWKQKEEKLQRFYATGCFTAKAEDEDVLYNLTDQDIDFGKMSIKNGLIKYDVEGDPNPMIKEISVAGVDRKTTSGSVNKASTSNPSNEPAETEERNSAAKEVSVSGISQKTMSGETPKPSTSDTVSERKSPTENGSVTNHSTGEVGDDNAPAETDSSGKPQSGTKIDSSGKLQSGTDVDNSGKLQNGTDVDNSSKPQSGAEVDSSGKPFGETESEIFAQNHVNCEDVYRSKNYRPSHLLYLVLVFWLTLTFITIYQLFCNFYLQMWVLTHSLLFTGLSFVSNGFHHFAAAMYFYKFGRKTPLERKTQ